MQLVTKAPVSPLEIARSRWDEASRVTSAFKIVLKRRKYRAYSLTGQAGELDAWADVAAAEAQVSDAEGKERKAWEDVALLERAAGEARLVKRLRINGGRGGR